MGRMNLINHWQYHKPDWLVDYVMEAKSISTISLENGLTLEMFDQSRPVAGDRWLVSFEARIEVEVKPEYLTDKQMPNVSFEHIRAVLGDTVFYRYEKVRNFIDETEKDEVFSSLKEHFLSTNLGYLSSPGFPHRLIIRKYLEASGQARVWKRHTR